MGMWRQTDRDWRVSDFVKDTRLVSEMKAIASIRKVQCLADPGVSFINYGVINWQSGKMDNWKPAWDVALLYLVGYYYSMLS